MKLSEFKDRLYSMANSNAIDITEIEKFIQHFFSSKPLPIAKINYNHFIRCSPNNPGELFKNVARCSYNPTITNINLLRCNYKGQQVFYASSPTFSSDSNAMSTAIIETHADHIKRLDIKHSYLTLSRWKLNRPLDLYIFPFSKKSIKRNTDFQQANDQFERQLLSLFGTHQSEAIEYFRSSLEFMSDIFCETDNKNTCYRISAAFSNAIMKLAKIENRNIDGLMYPSANTLGAGINVVLKKEVIDNADLECDYVQMYALQRNPADPESILFTDVSDGVTPDKNGDFSFR